MFVIFGTKNVGTTIGNGNFCCPRCNVERDYRLKQNKNYFSLFFIPIIPLGQTGDTLECSFCKTAYVPSSILSETEYTSSMASLETMDSPIASVGKRIGSYLIDMLILILLNFPLASVASYLPDFFHNKFQLVFLPVWVIYFFLMELIFNGTIGKKIFSIQITSENQDKKISVFQYLIRSIVKCIPLINIIFLFNDKKKGVHDYVANTIVVENYQSK